LGSGLDGGGRVIGRAACGGAIREMPWLGVLRGGSGASRGIPPLGVLDDGIGTVGIG
jgi:hypothetical protein